MRKLIWCCSAAGVLSACGFLSIVFYAYQNPQTLVGQVLTTAARATVTMQPLTGLASLAVQTRSCELPNQAAGSVEECVPADPQPVPMEVEAKKVEAGELAQAIEAAPPIVIHEEEPMPPEQVLQGAAGLDLNVVQGQDMPPNGCPNFMPFCQDDEQEVTPPPMPLADAEDKPVQEEPKSQEAGEESDKNVFKAWKKIFEAAPEQDSSEAEELPPPREEKSMENEPKCEEDCHRHEHYSGCPPMTCPYTGKTYYPSSCKPKQKAGQEESSEEPILPGKKSHKGKDDCPRTQGVDTMEFRPSDAGLNEYGPGPLQ